MNDVSGSFPGLVTLFQPELVVLIIDSCVRWRSVTGKQGNSVLGACRGQSFCLFARTGDGIV